jgi:hypothetical protein
MGRDQRLLTDLPRHFQQFHRLQNLSLSLREVSEFEPRPSTTELARNQVPHLADQTQAHRFSRRRIVKPDGGEVTVSVSGRRIDGPSESYGLWVLLPGLEPTNAVEMTIRMPDIVLAVTDHDWQIEYMSADAHLLGVEGSELRGFPLLGLVHPSAVTDFLAAITRTAVDHLAVTVLTRMRMGHDRWEDRYCLINRMCGHDPPRLGVVISAVPSTDAPATSEIVEQAHHCAVEAQASKDLDVSPV